MFSGTKPVRFALWRPSNHTTNLTQREQLEDAIDYIQRHPDSWLLTQCGTVTIRTSYQNGMFTTERLYHNAWHGVRANNHPHEPFMFSFGWHLAEALLAAQKDQDEDDLHAGGWDEHRIRQVIERRQLRPIGFGWRTIPPDAFGYDVFHDLEVRFDEDYVRIGRQLLDQSRMTERFVWREIPYEALALALRRGTVLDITHESASADSDSSA